MSRLSQVRAGLALLAVLACLSFSPPPDQLKEGDIIFHQGQSSQSQALILALDSRYTHMGMILKRDGRWVVLEAVQPVRYTSLRTFIARGKGRHYVIKRLKRADRVVTPEVIREMKGIARGLLGRDYDLQFMWSDRRWYCSELVWKLYERTTGVKIGTLKPVKELDVDLSHPLVQRKLRQRYGGKIPYDEPVMPPSEMFASDLLETVVEYP